MWGGRSPGFAVCLFAGQVAEFPGHRKAGAFVPLTALHCSCRFNVAGKSVLVSPTNPGRKTALKAAEQGS